MIAHWKIYSTIRDGTTHLVMTPLEFLQRLAALIPRPRLHLIRFHGASVAFRLFTRAWFVEMVQGMGPIAHTEAEGGVPIELGWLEGDRRLD